MGAVAAAAAAHAPDAIYTVEVAPTMHAGDIDAQAVDAWATGQTEVAEWQVSETLPIPTDLLYLGGEPQAGSVLQPALVTQNETFDLLLGLDDSDTQTDRTPWCSMSSRHCSTSIRWPPDWKRWASRRPCCASVRNESSPSRRVSRVASRGAKRATTDGSVR